MDARLGEPAGQPEKVGDLEVGIAAATQHDIAFQHAGMDRARHEKLGREAMVRPQHLERRLGHQELGGRCGGQRLVGRSGGQHDTGAGVDQQDADPCACKTMLRDQGIEIGKRRRPRG